MSKQAAESTHAIRKLEMKKEARPIKQVWTGIAMVATVSLFTLAQPAWGKLTTCKMTYSLEGWSAIYSTASGSGMITCDNGQSARCAPRLRRAG